MERLTDKELANKLKEHYYGDHDKTDEVYLRLAELEDMLESGELLKPPCKIGDTVYYVYSKSQYEPIPFVVDIIKATICNEGVLWRVFARDETYGGMYGERRVCGKFYYYIGADKSEAEAKLKELQESGR